MAEPNPVTREEFTEACQGIVAFRDLQKQQSEQIKTLGEVIEQKEKMIADKLAAHQAKSQSLEMQGPEDDREFPKYDPRMNLNPRIRALETMRPAQKRALNLETPRDECILEYQNAADELQLLAQFFEGRDKRAYVQTRTNKNTGARETYLDLNALANVAPVTVDKLRYYAKQIDPEFARAMDTGTEMAEWLPTLWSGQMIQLVRDEYLVGGLFPHISMPSATYELPVEGGDLTPTLVAQSTADPMADDWHLAAVTESDSTPTSPALVAKKFGCRSVISDEAVEDTIIPCLPYVQQKHVIAHAFALDEAITDGQATAQIDTGIDAGTMLATDRRKAWDGLRYIATQTKTGGNLDMSGGVTLDSLAQLRGKMKKFGGRRPNDLVCLTSWSGLYNLMKIDQTQTLEQYGPGATVLTGEMARINGYPIIICPNTIWEQLTVAGIYDNSDKTCTCLMLVNTRAFMVGDRTGYSYKVLNELYAAHGMIGVVSFSRYAFVDLFPSATDVSVAYGYKIGLA